MSKDQTQQPTEHQTYNEAYQKLRNGVDQLRRTDIANMDELVPLVEQTTAAYQVCRQRLEAVEKLVKGALNQAQESK